MSKKQVDKKEQTISLCHVEVEELHRFITHILEEDGNEKDIQSFKITKRNGKSSVTCEFAHTTTEFMERELM